MKFKKGDWIICINNCDFPNFITLGKSYLIEYVTDPKLNLKVQFLITGDRTTGYWNEDCFVLDVIKMRKLKLKKLKEYETCLEM